MSTMGCLKNCLLLQPSLHHKTTTKLRFQHIRILRSLWTQTRLLSTSKQANRSQKSKASLSQSESYVKDGTHFVTTPIFYVNAAPHVGHLYCSLLADFSARWSRIKGIRTLFSTGTDEHGLKIQQAAATSGVKPEAFCDKVASQFQGMFERGDIKYDRFIRTTEADHHRAVQHFWSRLKRRGHLYKSVYSGWYCVSDEAFLTDEEVEDKSLPDGTTVKVSKESGHPVSWTEEENYKFRLSQWKDELIHWLDTKDSIRPKTFEPLVRRMLEDLPDLSVSRDRSRLPWGIAVPDDHTQTIYVWLDALVNYLTVAGYPDNHPTPWPPTAHILGKDILKFHAIYWPAFLMAADLEPPSRLVVHSHWLVDNVKMSKSLGNVVDPMQKMQEAGTDGFRYFLLKEGSLANDGTYSDKRLAMRINSDLANTIGNLLGRCTSASVNKLQVFPICEREDDIARYLTEEECHTHRKLFHLPDQVDRLYQEFQVSKALELILSQCYWANSLVQSHQPWVLAKSAHISTDDLQHLRCVLHVAMETLRVCGILLQPIVPDISNRLLGKLGICESNRGLNDAMIGLAEEKVLQPGKCVLYPKIKVPEER